MTLSKEEVQGNYALLKQSIAKIAQASGRNPEEIQLVLVSKTVQPDLIQASFDMGARIFGENRVQELLKKVGELPDQARWHMIGHMQTNKVKQVLKHVQMIQSLDRMELFHEIEKQARKQSVEKVDCLIQVNVAQEESKSGFSVDEVSGFVESVPDSSVVKIRGLMVIGPHTNDEGKIRAVFKKTRELFESLNAKYPERKMDQLSMGMSGDYQIAIEEGATMVRVGSLVFGERKKV